MEASDEFESTVTMENLCNEFKCVIDRAFYGKARYLAFFFLLKFFTAGYLSLVLAEKHLDIFSKFHIIVSLSLGLSKECIGVLI